MYTFALVRGYKKAIYSWHLFFYVRGLTYTNVDVKVKLNNKVVGNISRYGGLNDADRNENAFILVHPNGGI